MTKIFDVSNVFEKKKKKREEKLSANIPTNITTMHKMKFFEITALLYVLLRTLKLVYFVPSTCSDRLFVT